MQRVTRLKVACMLAHGMPLCQHCFSGTAPPRVLRADVQGLASVRLSTTHLNAICMIAYAMPDVNVVFLGVYRCASCAVTST